MSGSAELAADRSGPKYVRRRHRLLLLLAFTSGAIDTIGLLGLGGVFTSVMTGNMIFLGSGLARGDVGTALRALIAIVAFMAGAFIGARIASTPRSGDYSWPRAVTAALALELVLLLGFSGGWWLSGAEPLGATRSVLLVAVALALGVQSSAILRFGISGLSTTYMTGTLTTVVSALAAGRHPRNVASSAQILTSLVIGAAVAALVHKYAPAAVPLVALGPVLLVMVMSLTFGSRRNET